MHCIYTCIYVSLKRISKITSLIHLHEYLPGLNGFKSKKEHVLWVRPWQLSWMTKRILPRPNQATFFPTRRIIIPRELQIYPTIHQKYFSVIYLLWILTTLGRIQIGLYTIPYASHPNVNLWHTFGKCFLILVFTFRSFKIMVQN